ncbi:tripartite tricarboxylate transporter TctB family protein [Pseudohoeflea suaedae]|nr:tripartite tricarboxylate transporter TctB family protein [Pseudohoeflea suaedae]
MKVHDIIVGIVILALGLCVATYSTTLVAPRNLNYGPGFFPLLVGCGLALVGLVISLQGLRNLRVEPVFVLPEWARSAQMALRFWILPGSILFYVFAVEALGFLATATLILTAAMAAGGIHLFKAFVAGLLVAVATNVAFASLLHVPLPWGPLTSISGWLIW